MKAEFKINGFTVILKDIKKTRDNPKEVIDMDVMDKNGKIVRSWYTGVKSMIETLGELSREVEE